MLEDNTPTGTEHKPGELEPSQNKRLQHLQDLMTAVLAEFEENCSPSRELSLAKTKIEEAMFWATSAIARETPEN